MLSKMEQTDPILAKHGKMSLNNLLGSSQL